eukprot:1015480-Prorocentrum_minimum.AAC.2
MGQSVELAEYGFDGHRPESGNEGSKTAGLGRAQQTQRVKHNQRVGTNKRVTENGAHVCIDLRHA